MDYILLGPSCKSYLVVLLIIYDSVNNSVLVFPWFFIILYGPMLSTTDLKLSAFPFTLLVSKGTHIYIQHDSPEQTKGNIVF